MCVFYMALVEHYQYASTLLSMFYGARRAFIDMTSHTPLASAPALTKGNVERHNSGMVTYAIPFHKIPNFSPPPGGTWEMNMINKLCLRYHTHKIPAFYFRQEVLGK